MLLYSIYYANSTTNTDSEATRQDKPPNKHYRGHCYWSTSVVSSDCRDVVSYVSVIRRTLAPCIYIYMALIYIYIYSYLGFDIIFRKSQRQNVLGRDMNNRKVAGLYKWHDKGRIYWHEIPPVQTLINAHRMTSRHRHISRVTGTLCEGNPLVTGGFPSQRASNGSFGF